MIFSSCALAFNILENHKPPFSEGEGRGGVRSNKLNSSLEEAARAAYFLSPINTGYRIFADITVTAVHPFAIKRQRNVAVAIDGDQAAAAFQPH